jgi:hypothetical protein
MKSKLHWLKGWSNKARRWAYLCDTKKTLKRKGRTIRYTKDPEHPDLCSNCKRKMGEPS